MKHLLPASVLFVFLSACTSGDLIIDTAESESHYKLGIEFAKLSLYKNSLEEFDLAIKHDPNNLKVYRKKGLVHFGLKQHDLAQEAFEAVLSQEPENVQVHINLGMVFYVKGKKEKARKEWEQAISIQDGDNDSRAFNNIANIYKEEKKYDKGIEYYQQAIVQEPNNSIYLNITIKMRK